MYVRFHIMQFACVISTPNTPLSGFSPYIIFNGRELMLLTLQQQRWRNSNITYGSKIILQQGETLTFSSSEFWVHVTYTIVLSKSISTYPITRGCRHHSLVSMITARLIVFCSALVIIVPDHVFADKANNILSTNFSPGKSLTFLYYDIYNVQDQDF